MDPVERTELGILSEIGRISNSPDDLQRKLQRIIEVVMRGMGREGASAFLLDESGQNVTMTAAIGLNQETVGRLTFPLGRGIAGWVAEQKVPLALSDPYTDPRFQYVPESGIERFKSLVAAPIMDGDTCLGVLFMLSAAAWHASSQEITLLTTTANQVSGVIRSTLLFQNIQHRLAELATIHEIGMALGSTLDLDQLLSLIARGATQALRAQGCTIRLTDLPAGPDAAAPPVTYVTDAVRDLDARLGARSLERAVASRRPLLVQDASRDPAFRDIAGPLACSFISAPLISHDRPTGVITLYNRQDEQPFREEDAQFLSTIAGAAAVAVENAALFKRTELLAAESRTRAQELAILYDIGAAMSATLNLDRLLRIILTAATMGGSGLGFNRAILLLTNERSNTLQGMMGVGPSSWDEANRAWTEVARKHQGLLEWVHTGELFESKDTEFNSLARSIRVPLEPGGGILAHTVLDKKAFNITDAAADTRVRKDIPELLKVNSFATVPLVAKGRVIGAILVDNLFTGRPITDRDIRFLTMFAHQAALAIDNAVIHSNMENLNRDIHAMHEQLAQSEKMAALGSMMAEITHEIRNPLVSIGGFARRLARKAQDEDTKRYSDIILSEVARLEGIIHDNLAYIKNAEPQSSRAPLNAVLDEVIALHEDEYLQRGVRIDRSLAESLPDLDMDAAQIKQAVVNLMTNALEAMEQGGVLSIRTFALADRRETVIEVGDTGPGVSPESMQNLFNPYYTTKVRGTGLGLPITHRIVTAHKGSIVFRNKETGGALFIVRLPWPKEK